MKQREIEVVMDTETGDLILSYHDGLAATFLLDERDRDTLQDTLQFLRWDEEKQNKGGRLSLFELRQDQDYWEAKFNLKHRKDMVDYINFHTADKAREAAILSNIDLDDLLLR
tara:strand:- start:139 stop:477 length:339 start_codon:yes stop_codon:yes gene_type:complete